MPAPELPGLQAFSSIDAAGQPQLEDEETVLNVFHKLRLIAGAEADQGEGTVFITQGRIIWLAKTPAPSSSSGSSSSQPAGWAVEFPAITMHAVASDPQACLYVQLDSEEGEQQGGGEDEEGDSAEGPPELRLIPDDPSTLDALFKAFCEGAERNPDYGSDDQGDFYFDQDEVLAGAANAALGVGDVEELVGDDPGRFDDAEDQDEDEDAFEEFEEQQQAEQPQQNGRAA